MSDSAFMRSARDPSVPYVRPESDEEWDLLRRAALHGLAHRADQDGMIEVDWWSENLSALMNATGHERGWWVWQEFEHAPNETDEADEYADVLDDTAELLRWSIELGELEWVTRDHKLHLRICNLEAALADTVQLDGRIRPAESRVNRLAELRHMPYAEYLRSDEWRERRKRHLEYAGNRCQLCNSAQQPLHVHHRTYERRGFERSADLVVLCAACHEAFHKSKRVR